MKNQNINQDNQSIYCYPETSILINKKDIKDKIKLEKVENMLVNYKLAELISGKEPFKRNLTYEHYIKLHEYLFGDLYPFAGKLREEFTNKSNEEVNEEGIRIYCDPNFIYGLLNEQLGKMKKQAVKVSNRKEFISFLANSYMELYFIHPFREGNSRTLREFLREYVEIMNKLLIKFGNYSLEYSNLNEEDRFNFIRSTVWNISKDKNKQDASIPMLESIFDKCLMEYELGEKTK